MAACVAVGAVAGLSHTSPEPTEMSGFEAPRPMAWRTTMRARLPSRHTTCISFFRHRWRRKKARRLQKTSVPRMEELGLRVPASVIQFWNGCGDANSGSGESGARTLFKGDRGVGDSFSAGQPTGQECPIVADDSCAVVHLSCGCVFGIDPRSKSGCVPASMLALIFDRYIYDRTRQP